MPRTRAVEDAATDTDGSVPALRDPRYSQSLERGLAILSCFSPERPVLGIANIADQLGMSRSTTHRYVTTLVALGYLEQEMSRKYRLAVRVTTLGMAAIGATGLRNNSHPFLEELRQKSAYTSNLAILDGDEIVYVDRARSFQRGQYKIDMNLRPGARLPASCTAMGKVLLAFMPDGDLREAVANIELPKRGPKSIVTKKALRAELAAIREHGVAVNDEELAPNLISIAAPVRCAGEDVIAAINIAAHTSMTSLNEMTSTLTQPLLETAATISARLGSLAT